MDFFLSLAKHDLYFRVPVVKCRMIVHPPLYSLLGPTLWLVQLLNPKLIYTGQQKNRPQFPVTKVPHMMGVQLKEMNESG